MTTYNVEIVVNGKDNASGPLGRVGGVLGNIAQIAGGILSAQVLTGIASGIGGMAREALDSYASFERLGMSLQSLSARELLNTGAAKNMSSAMEMAKGKAAELQGWITKLAIQSPFNQEDVAQSFRLAMAYGFTTKEAQRLTQATIDFAAGSGASGYAMQQIALALGQVKAKGNLAGQEILQLTNAGLDVRGILAKAFGVTTEELIRMQEKGLIPADKAIEAITQSLERDFGGAAKAQAATFSGLIASLQDIKSVGLREFFAGTFKAIQPYVSTFVDTLSSPEFMAKVRGFGEALGNVVASLLKFGQTLASGNLSQISDAVVGAIIDMAGRLGWTKEKLIKALKAWTDFRRGLGIAIDNIKAYFQRAISAWDTLKKGFTGEKLMDIIQGAFGVLAGGGLLALFAPVGANIGSLIFGSLITFFSGGQAMALGGLLASKLFSGLLVSLSKYSPLLGGAFFRMFMVKGTAAKMIAGLGKQFAKMTAPLASFAKFLTPLANIVTLVAPVALLAGAVMTLVGAFSLLSKGKLIPMLQPVGLLLERIGAVVARIAPVIMDVGKKIWESFIANSEKLASQIIPWLVEQLEKFADWFAINEPLIKKFITVVGDFIANGLLPAIADAWKVIEPILGGIISIFLDLVTLIMQVVTGDWAGAWDTLGQIVQDAASAIWQAFVNLLDFIARRMGTSLEEIGKVWAGNWELLTIIASKQWNKTAEDFKAWTTQLGTTASQLGTIISVSFTNWTTQLGITASQLGFIIANGFANWSNSIATWINDLGTTASQLGAIIAYVWQQIVSAVGSGVSSIATAVQSWWSSFVATWTGNWNLLVSILTGVASRLIASVAQLISQIQSGFQSAWSNMIYAAYSFVVDLMNTFNAKIQAFYDTGVSYLGNLYNGFVNAISQQWNSILGLGTKFVDGIKTGISNAWDAFVDWLMGQLSGLVDQILSSLGAGSTAKFSGMGKSMMTGLAKGIKSAAGLPQLALDANMPTISESTGGSRGKTGLSTVNNSRQQTSYFGPVTFVTQSNQTDQDALRRWR